MIILARLAVFSQAQTSKWYFGNNAGLDVTGITPSVLTGGATTSTAGCSVMSNGQGSLLFYTDGVTVWNQTNAVMANGTGLSGNNSAQSSVIVQKPASSQLYYIFTVQGGGGAAGLSYSIVDMTLAGGNGSVTVKNASLFPSPCEEKISAVRQCDQSDVWVMVKELGNNIFRAHLLTSAGVSTAAVTSTIGAIRSTSSIRGSMKFSPNGHKMAEVYSTQNGLGGITSFSLNLYDFDNSTGLLTNGYTVSSFLCPTGNCWTYGCEFAPNSSQVYYTYHGYIFQYNACGIPTGNGSLGQIDDNNILTYNRASMQLAPNGKIYVAKVGATTLDVINNPNLMGSASGYSINSQTLGLATVGYGLPNFMTSYLEQMPAPFNYSVNANYGCMNLAFSSPSICTSSGYTLSTAAWNFGDPGSGSANTSTGSTTSHLFSAPGTYTVRLISYYMCNKNDTLYKTVTVSAPTLTALTGVAGCGPTSATLVASGAVGPMTYTWNPSLQTNSVASGITPGQYTVNVMDGGSGCGGNFTVNVPSVTFSLAVNNVSCFGQGNGSASVTLNGATSPFTYSWSNNVTGTNNINGLSPGIYSVSAVNPAIQCNFFNTFLITQPPQLLLSINLPAPNACAGNNFILSAGTTGGTLPYFYNWTGGPTVSVYNVFQQNPGLYTYSCSVNDAKNCTATTTVAVNFAAVPLVTVSSASVCPGATASLTATGANNFIWYPGSSTFSVLNVSPAVSSNYTVIGSSLGCSGTAISSVTVLQKPVVNITTNSPVCQGAAINFYGSGGTGFSWSGPQNYFSTQQNPVISPALPSNAGTYVLIVTAVNSCTSSATVQVAISPAPLLSIAGSSVICPGQSVQLQAFGANTYTWSTGSNASAINVSPAASTIYSLNGAGNANSCVGSVTFAVNVSQCTSLGEIVSTGAGIKLFPNPARNILYIETLKTTHIYVYSDLSSNLIETTIDIGVGSVDLSPFSNGVYFVKAINEFGIGIYKLVRLSE